MKLATGFALAILAGLCAADGCYLGCKNDKCLRAIQADSVVASSFCAKTVPYYPTTTTTTAIVTRSNCATVTSTISLSEWVTEATTQFTVTTVRVTTTDEPEPTGGPIDKRANAAACAKIIDKCGNDKKQITSACYCFLGGIQPTFTATTTSYAPCTETALFTTAVTYTTTLTETVATSTATRTVPTQAPVLENPGFDRDLSESPWSIGRLCFAFDGASCSYQVVPDAQAPTAPNVLALQYGSTRDGSDGTVFVDQDMKNLDMDVTYRIAFSYKASGSEGGISVTAYAGRAFWHPDIVTDGAWHTVEVGLFKPTEENKQQDKWQFQLEVWFTTGEDGAGLGYNLALDNVIVEQASS